MYNVIPDFEVSEGSPLKGSDFIQELLYSLQKQTLEPSTIVGIVIDANHPEISCEDNKPTPQHKLSDLQCSNEPAPKFKDGYFLKFLMCLPDAKHPNLQGKVTVVQACL